VEQPREVWSLKKGVADVPVPLVLADRLFVLNDAGVMTCCSVSNGKIHWKKRFKGPFSASPVSAAGRIYAANEEGRTLVIDPQTGDILSENPLPEPIFATPALAGEQIYIRTREALYAIEQSATEVTLRPQPHASNPQAN
jgi:outer membrane protein assembly factor BamB